MTPYISQVRAEFLNHIKHRLEKLCEDRQSNLSHIDKIKQSKELMHVVSDEVINFRDVITNEATPEIVEKAIQEFKFASDHLLNKYLEIFMK